MIADGNRVGATHYLRDFWESARRAGVVMPQDDPISASALTQARAKLSGVVMRELLWKLVQQLPNGCNARRAPTWRGRRVFAVDGKKANVNRSDELRTEFGTPEGCYCPQILYSVLFDCCARMPVDYEVDGHRASERDHLARMLDSIDEGAIVVLDRGYPSHEVIAELAGRPLDFLIRLPCSNSFAAIDEFLASGARDQRVALMRRAANGDDELTAHVRLVRIDRGGETLVFATSLSSREVDRRGVDELYHLRWQAEECFKAISTGPLSQGLFRARTANSVRQDVGAAILYYAISRVLAGAATDHIDDERCHANQRASILEVTRILSPVILAADPEEAVLLIEASLRHLSKLRSRERPGRTHPRRSYTPAPKWSPGGRRGA